MAGQINIPLSKSEIASLDIREPLAESALLAEHWSKTHCDGCESYHGAWQILRLLGVLNSMRSDDDFLIGQLDIAIGNGAKNILVSGAADYALQARIAAVAKRHHTSPNIFVIDLCRTPLELNRWYGEQMNMDVQVIQGNILNYTNPEYFDLICTHSFLPFFNEEERISLIKVWWNCLTAGGAVLTAQRTRPNTIDTRHGFSPSQSNSLGERAYLLATEHFDRYGIEPQKARDLAIKYASNRSTYVLRDKEQLRQLFQRQGFKLEQFAPPDHHQLEKDVPSTPTETGHHRMRILARKPLV